MIGSPLGEMNWQELQRHSAILDIGCIACRLRGIRVQVPCQAHHLTVGGRHGAPRRGHMQTIGLCDWHHNGRTGGRDRSRLRRWLGPSYAGEAAAFRETFGDDHFLLDVQEQLIRKYRELTSIQPRRVAG